MNQRIPSGVVTTTDGLTTELQRSEAVSPDDVAQLWKVYTTQSSKIQDAVTCRLENLFWRLWADPKLQKGLSGVTLATLFMAIHESSSVHATPSKVTDHSQPNDTTQVTILTITQSDGPGSREGSKSPLPPILKNSAGAKSQPPSEPSSYKTARIVIPDQPTQRPTKNAGTANNNKAAGGLGSSKQTRKRQSFVANTSASARRRGVVMRRKSPITTPTVEMEEPFPPAVIEQIAEREEAEETDKPESAFKDHSNKMPEDAEVPWRSLSYLKPNDDDITSKQASLAASPSSPPPANFSVSSVARHRSPDDVQVQQTAVPAKSNTTLVDRDFRTSFVERKRHESVGNKGGASSSLTSNLSSSQFKDLLVDNNNDNTSASTAIPSVPRSLSPTKRHTNTSSALSLSLSLSSPRKRDSGPAPMAIISTSQTQFAPSSTQKTTSGVFSVSKQSSQDIGEQLTSLMRSK